MASTGVNGRTEAPWVAGDARPGNGDGAGPPRAPRPTASSQARSVGPLTEGRRLAGLKWQRMSVRSTSCPVYCITLQSSGCALYRGRGYEPPLDAEGECVRGPDRLRGHTHR